MSAPREIYKFLSVESDSGKSVASDLKPNAHGRS